MNRYVAAVLACMSLMGNPAEAKPITVELEGFPLPPAAAEDVDLEYQCLVRIEAAKQLGMFDRRSAGLMTTPVVVGAALGHEVNEQGGYDFALTCHHKGKVKIIFR